jgi:hypothetical protein
LASIQINVRLKPYQVYEIKKISEHFDTTPSIVIRNAIDDYIDIFKTWGYRFKSKKLVQSDECKVEYTPKKSDDHSVNPGLCFHPSEEPHTP